MYKYQAKVVKVVDGDTIDVDIDLGFHTILSGQRIRLFGIDSPEIRGAYKNQGRIAKAWLKAKIESKTIELLTIKDSKSRTYYSKGKYGRWLGIVYLKNQNINELLVEKELAVVKRY